MIVAIVNEGVKCAGHIVRGPDKVFVISVGDRVHAGMCCLDGLQCVNQRAIQFHQSFRLCNGSPGGKKNTEKRTPELP